LTQSLPAKLPVIVAPVRVFLKSLFRNFRFGLDESVPRLSTAQRSFLWTSLIIVPPFPLHPLIRTTYQHHRAMTSCDAGLTSILCNLSFWPPLLNSSIPLLRLPQSPILPRTSLTQALSKSLPRQISTAPFFSHTGNTPFLLAPDYSRKFPPSAFFNIRFFRSPPSALLLG